jgi:predicted transcriptional regulator
MAENPMIGCRVSPEYLAEIDTICQSTGRTRSQVLLEAIEVYLGKTSSVGINSELEAFKKRLETVEKKLTAWTTYKAS